MAIGNTSLMLLSINIITYVINRKNLQIRGGGVVNPTKKFRGVATYPTLICHPARALSCVFPYITMTVLLAYHHSPRFDFQF